MGTYTWFELLSEDCLSYTVFHYDALKTPIQYFSNRSRTEKERTHERRLFRSQYDTLVSSSDSLLVHHSLFPEEVIGRSSAVDVLPRWNLHLKGRGKFGNLLTSGCTVEVTLEHFLEIGLYGSIRCGFQDYVLLLL